MTSAPSDAGDTADDVVANAEMVGVLRDARGWTQKRLAVEANVSQGYISKVESRLIDLTGPNLISVAHALDAPVELLAVRGATAGLEVSCMFHRRRSSRVTVSDGRRVEAIGRLTRLSVDGLAEGLDRATATLRRIDIDQFGSAETIAQLARAEWRVPSGPIPDMMALLDRLGVATIVRSVGTAGQDAFSTWPAGRTPVIVVNIGLPVDRLRYSLAHELGHVVMHVLPNDNQEQQADEFASELLMPSDDIAEELAGLTTSQFNRLLELKAKWRVSVGALVRKALSLEIISDRQFKQFRIRLAQMGWNTSEPVQLPAEQPRLLAQIVETRRERGESDDELARRALMTTEAFRRHYLTREGDANA